MITEAVVFTLFEHHLRVPQHLAQERPDPSPGEPRTTPLGQTGRCDPYRALLHPHTALALVKGLIGPRKGAEAARADFQVANQHLFIGLGGDDNPKQPKRACGGSHDVQ